MRSVSRLAVARRGYCTHPFMYTDKSLKGEYARPDVKVKYEPHAATSAGSVTSGGMRVLSLDKGDATSLISYYIDCGAIYETDATAGTSHYLREMLLSSNLVSSDYHIYKTFQGAGARSWTEAVDRRWISVKVEARRDQVGVMVAALSEALFVPRFAPHELYKLREKVENIAVCRDHDGMSFVSGKLSEVAYQGTPYGAPIDCPTYNTEKLTSVDLINWWSASFVPSRVQLVGVNLTQEELLGAYDEAEWSTANAATNPSHESSPLALPGDAVKEAYTGGELRQFTRFTEKFPAQKHYEDVFLGFARKADATHQAANLIIAASVPTGATPFYDTTDAAGLVGGVIKTRPEHADAALKELASSINSAGKLSGEALAAAKARAVLTLLGKTDTRSGASDFLAQNSTAHGLGQSVEDLAVAIAAVDEKALKGAVDVLMSAQPTFVGLGDLSATPNLTSVA